MCVIQADDWFNSSVKREDFIECSHATFTECYVSRWRIISFRFTATSSVRYIKSGLYSQIAWPELDIPVFWFVDSFSESHQSPLTYSFLSSLVSNPCCRCIILVLSWRIRKYACKHCFSESYRHPDMSIVIRSFIVDLWFKPKGAIFFTERYTWIFQRFTEV